MSYQRPLAGAVFFFLLAYFSFAGYDSSPLIAEKTRFAAQVSSDTLVLANLLHPDLKYIHSNGMIETAASFVQSVARKRIVYKSMDPVAETHVRYPSEKIAVADGQVHVTGLLNGNAFDLKLIYTSVYIKVADKWLLYAWQSAKLP